MSAARPFVVGIGGVESNVGKTSVLCELLRLTPGSEAIKTTRGHYRSCGKDPHSCCVSHLLTDKPIVNSDRKQTEQPGKDTGRYWQAGAENVHWVIATTPQLKQGTKQAFGRVKSRVVFVEGNSFAQFLNVDLMLMVARTGEVRIKSSAKKILSMASGLVLLADNFSDASHHQKAEFRKWFDSFGLPRLPPIYSWSNLPALADSIREMQQGMAA